MHYKTPREDEFHNKNQLHRYSSVYICIMLIEYMWKGNYWSNHLNLIVLMISVCVNGSSLYVLLYKVPILIRIKQENNKHINRQGNAKYILYEMAISKTQTHSTNGKQPKRPYHITRSCLCKSIWFSWIVVIQISREVTR